MRAGSKIGIGVVGFLMVSAVFAFGQATNVYVTPNGTATGNCPAGTSTAPNFTPAQFNNSSNWGTGTGQIGPGTTVLMCGTFTSSTQGGTMLTPQGSGTSGNPIVMECDTTCNFQSTGWWGNYNSSLCPTCTGAITLNSVNYITLDGKGYGVIENMLAGCTSGCSGGSAATCPGGTCTQSPGTAGTVGIHIYGTGIIVQNWTIEYMYVNAGSTSAATDTGGQYSVDIRVDGCSKNVCSVAIGNNYLFDARAGIWGSLSGSTGAASCPGSGVCYYNNKLANHVWPMLLNESASGGIVNVYNNEIGDDCSGCGGRSGWSNWYFPSGTYHTSGMFITGTSSLLTAYVWNNYLHGSLGGSTSGTSPSGMLYCPTWSATANAGSACIGWNDVIVAGTGDQAIAINQAGGSGGSDNITQPSTFTLYNSTVIGGAYSAEYYTTGATNQSCTETFENDIFDPSGVWFYNASNGGTYLASWTADYNDYYSGTDWQYNNNSYSTLSSWQSACSCDANSTTNNPSLNASTYEPTSSTPNGTNLTSLCTGNLVGLCTDAAGNSRPSSGSWTMGAYQYSSGAPVAPTGLTAVVN